MNPEWDTTYCERYCERACALILHDVETVCGICGRRFYLSAWPVRNVKIEMEEQ